MDTKKILSILLSIALVFSLIPIGSVSFAQDTPATASLETAVELTGTVGQAATKSIKIVLNGATFKDVDDSTKKMLALGFPVLSGLEKVI